MSELAFLARSFGVSVDDPPKREAKEKERRPPQPASGAPAAAPPGPRRIAKTKAKSRVKGKAVPKTGSSSSANATANAPRASAKGKAKARAQAKKRRSEEASDDDWVAEDASESEDERISDEEEPPSDGEGEPEPEPSSEEEEEEGGKGSARKRGGRRAAAPAGKAERSSMVADRWLLMSQALWNVVKSFLDINAHGRLASVSKSAKLLVEAGSNQLWEQYIDELESQKDPHCRWHEMDREEPEEGEEGEGQGAAAGAPPAAKRQRTSTGIITRPVGPGEPVPPTPWLKRLYVYMELQRVCPGSEICDEKGEGCDECTARITKTTAKQEWLLSDRILADVPHELRRNPHYRSAAPMQLFEIRDVARAALDKYGTWAGFRVAIRKRQERREKLRGTRIWVQAPPKPPRQRNYYGNYGYYGAPGGDGCAIQ